MLIWTNDYEGESGVTVGYRFLNAPTKWIYYTVDIPGKSKWTIQLSYLDWGRKMASYTRWCKNLVLDTNDMPFFYKPKGTDEKTIVEWAEKDAHRDGYAHLMPYIRYVIKGYAKDRW